MKRFLFIFLVMLKFMLGFIMLVSAALGTIATVGLVLISIIAYVFHGKNFYHDGYIIMAIMCAPGMLMMYYECAKLGSKSIMGKLLDWRTNLDKYHEVRRIQMQG